jgi:undecaprenyl-diphosphatase
MIVKVLDTIQWLDLRAFDWCLKRKYRQLIVGISRWVSRSADGHLYIVVAVVTVIFEQWLLFQILTSGFAIERIIYFILKNYLKRHRPQQAIPSFTSVIQPSDQFSFPSGHTSAAFFMLGVFSHLPSIFLWPLFVWAITVGMSRVMLGVHFPTDIVAGAALGYSVSLFVVSFIIV